MPSKNGSAKEDVILVQITVPVYVGKVDTTNPDYVDKLAYRLLTTDQRQGLNRLWQGYNKLQDTKGISMPTELSRSECARHVLSEIAKACAQVAK